MTQKLIGIIVIAPPHSIALKTLRTRNYHMETAAIISPRGSGVSMVPTIGAKKTDCAAKSRAKGTITMRRAYLLSVSC